MEKDKFLRFQHVARFFYPYRFFLVVFGLGLVVITLNRSNEPTWNNLTSDKFVVVQEYPLPVGRNPASLIPDDFFDLIWFVSPQMGTLGRLNRKTHDVDYYPLGTGARPIALVKAQDNKIYVLDRALNVIHCFAPETQEVTRIVMPDDTPFMDLTQIQSDKKNKIWFSGARGWLGSYDVTSEKVELSFYEDLAGINHSAFSPDGTIWFVAGRGKRIIQIDPDRFRFEAITIPPDARHIKSMIAGKNGEIWLLSASPPRLMRYQKNPQNCCDKNDPSLTTIKNQAPLPSQGVSAQTEFDSSKNILKTNILKKNEIDCSKNKLFCAKYNYWKKIPFVKEDSYPQSLILGADGSLLIADAGRKKLIQYHIERDEFTEIADLGEVVNINAMILENKNILYADYGAGMIRVFSPSEKK